MKKNLGTFIFASRCGVGAVLLALCAFAPASRAGVQYAITFTDGGANVGAGTIDVASGVADSGTFTVTAGAAVGTYTLHVGSGNDTHFSYDSVVNVGSNPFLTSDGLLFTSGSTEINLAGISANNYSFASYNGVSYNVSTTGSSTLTPVPEPINCALAAFGLVFVGGSGWRFYLGRRRSATAN